MGKSYTKLRVRYEESLSELEALQKSHSELNEDYEITLAERNDLLGQLKVADEQISRQQAEILDNREEIERQHKSKEELFTERRELRTQVANRGSTIYGQKCEINRLKKYVPLSKFDLAFFMTAAAFLGGAGASMLFIIFGGA